MASEFNGHNLFGSLTLFLLQIYSHNTLPALVTHCLLCIGQSVIIRAHVIVLRFSEWFVVQYPFILE